MDVPKDILRLMALIAAGQGNGFIREFDKLADFEVKVEKELYTIDLDESRALTAEGWRLLQEHTDEIS